MLEQITVDKVKKTWVLKVHTIFTVLSFQRKLIITAMNSAAVTGTAC